MAVQITDMRVERTDIDGLLVCTLKQVSDERGTVREFYRASGYGEVLVGAGEWRQINVTESGYGAVRGLHGEAMTKLVSCVSGKAFGAYLDARPDSPTHGAVVTVELSPGIQVLVPAGVCNGFQSLSPEGTQYLYCFTEEWQPGMAGVAYTPLDDKLGIAWPLPIDPDDPACISVKDATAPAFSEVG
ncbi:MAG TPA: dTDP-4-dehydrorhamnose 3,5-epimerase [Jatrophihabitans sp.]|nr:dTDP-4-dehydrorhamnose 3,5-epimerase [Jatrophihabitans sp.]